MNLFGVWFLVGFWHGAAWNFILWGLFIFMLQIIEKNLTLRWLNADNIFAKVFSHTYMFFYILVSWTLFAISDFHDLGVYLTRLFPFVDTGRNIHFSDFTGYASTYAPLLVACIIFATDYPEKLFNRLRGRFLGIVISLVIFWVSVYYLSIGINNPFLYFRY